MIVLHFLLLVIFTDYQHLSSVDKGEYLTTYTKYRHYPIAGKVGGEFKLGGLAVLYLPTAQLKSAKVSTRVHTVQYQIRQYCLTGRLEPNR